MDRTQNDLIYALTDEENAESERQYDNDDKRSDELLNQLCDPWSLPTDPEGAEKTLALYEELRKICSRHAWREKSAYYYAMYLFRLGCNKDAEKVMVEAIPQYYFWSRTDSSIRDSLMSMALVTGTEMRDQDAERSLDYLKFCYRELKLMSEEDKKSMSSSNGQIFTALASRMKDQDKQRQVLTEGERYWRHFLEEMMAFNNFGRAGMLDYLIIVRKLLFLLIESGEIQACDKLIQQFVSLEEQVYRKRTNPDGTKNDTEHSVNQDVETVLSWSYMIAGEYYLLFNRAAEGEEYLSKINPEAAAHTLSGIQLTQTAETKTWWTALLHGNPLPQGVSAYHIMTWNNLRSVLQQKMSDVRGAEGGNVWKMTVEMMPAYLKKICNAFQSEADYSDIIGFLDESPLRDGSRGVLVTMEGIRIRKHIFRILVFPWNLIVSTTVLTDGTMVIERAGTTDQERIKTSRAQNLADLIRTAQSALHRETGTFGENEKNIPLPEEGLAIPTAVMQRFGIGTEV